ncbi:FtsW/RodA/SpoVE family cell cycle protein, partial [Candidatus Latescibacterota bacterium]
MEEHQTVDFWFLISAIILAGIGLVMVYSASMYLSLDKLGYGSFYFKKQAFNLLIGLFVMMFLTKVNYRGYAKLGTALLILGYIMLSILIVQKYLLDYEGAHRWLRIGKFSFQPSEFMKIIMIIYLSSAIMKMDEKVRDFKKGFLPLLGTIGLSFILVVLEPDLGISGLLLITGLYVLFIGRAKLIHLIIISIP